MTSTISKKLLNKMSYIRKQQDKNYTLYTGLVDKNTFDNKNLFPVFEGDLIYKTINTATLLEQINKKGKVELYSFFLRAEYAIVKKLADRKRPFYGVIKTKNSSYKIAVEVRRSQKYIEQLAKLFDVYQQNQIPWRTPCAPYFYKMFDVYIVMTNLPWYEEILSIDINYEDYSDKIEKEKIPVWNLEKVMVKTDLRPVYEEERQQYHYVIGRQRLKENTRYLIADNQIGINNCYMKGGLHFFCDKELERKWQLYRIETHLPQVSEELIFYNSIDNMGISATRTVGGIYRLVYELGYQERYKLERVEVFAKEETGEEIYSVCKIWEEFTAHHHRKKKLKLVFKKKIDDYLQTDILSYLVSEVQRQYPEYCCIAEVM